MNDVWTQIERIPAEMAAAVRPHLEGATLDGYKRYLDAMAHYTRASGERLRHAAEGAPTEDLKTLFGDLAREEAGHHKLAEADVAALGGALTEATPQDVEAFHALWMRGDASVWLGALYALESVGAHLAADAQRNLGRLGLARDQVRFVMVHLEADLEHGAAAASHTRAWIAHDPTHANRVLEAARYAANFWVGLHQRALSGDA